MKFILTISFLSVLVNAFGQCNVQTVNRPDGAIIKSTPAEPIGKTNKQEVGLSVQTNGEQFFLATVQRYYSKAKKLGGSLYIVLNDNNSVELELYTSYISIIGESEVALGVFLLTDKDISKLKKSSIKNIMLFSKQGYQEVIPAIINAGTLKKQFACLKK